MHKLISSLLQALGVTSAPTIPPDRLAAVTGQRRPVSAGFKLTPAPTPLGPNHFIRFPDGSQRVTRPDGSSFMISHDGQIYDQRPAPAPRGPVTQAVGAGRGPTGPETIPDRPRGANGPAGERLTITDGPGHDLSPEPRKPSLMAEIERQEAAEKLLRSMGWQWNGDKWELPKGANPFAAIAYALDYASVNGDRKAVIWLTMWQRGYSGTRAELADAIKSGEISY